MGYQVVEANIGFLERKYIIVMLVIIPVENSLPFLKHY
jgi:hypothetical protein